MSHHSEEHAHETEAAAPDNVTPEDMPGAAPDIVCVCGHPKAEHTMYGYQCSHTSYNYLCDCIVFRAGRGVAATTPPAAQLRERLQKAERERDTYRASLKNWRAIAKDLADMLGICQMECGVTEALLSKSEEMAEQTEAEAERLRGQCAAWMDAYNAAKVAEDEAYREGYEDAKLQATFIATDFIHLPSDVFFSKYKRTYLDETIKNMKSDSAPAPRPDSEAKP